MVVVRVLKRKDAASVLVAIVLAIAVSTFLASVSIELSNKIAGVETGLDVAREWQEVYLQPFILLLLQVVFLEVLAWIVIGLKDFWKSAK